MNKAFEYALSLHGLKEIVGSRHEKLIVEFFKEVGHSWIKTDETPWCCAFMGACLKKGGYHYLKEVAARKYLKYGTPTETPKIGDIVIFKRGNSSWQGHVAFYVREDEEYIHVLGGNQSNAVNISRYPKSKLLGYRRIKQPKAVKGVLDYIDALEDEMALLINDLRQRAIK